MLLCSSPRRHPKAVRIQNSAKGAVTYVGSYALANLTPEIPRALVAHSFSSQVLGGPFSPGQIGAREKRFGLGELLGSFIN